ncbi:hypothetical protein [Frigoribacterium faeni]|uniref:hypothetical protein n=1 Tax=Frigoribacterium faeni TaxID=145483 RepID=UPI00141ACB26|nr:hypothetical protein [Frigoribacterium faeni]NIJ05735.1 hypothetical protein [Frigoribacterium faeni]
MSSIYDSLVAQSAETTPIYRSLRSRLRDGDAAATPATSATPGPGAVPGPSPCPARAEVATAPRRAAPPPLSAVATWPLGRISG